MPLLIILLIILGISFWLYWTDREDPEHPIDEELIKAAKGNRWRVKQLLAEARANHPHQSEQWYRGKVFYELESREKYALSRTTHPRDRISFREIVESLVIFSLVASLISSLSYSLGQLFRSGK